MDDSFFCIYGGAEHPASERSIEHIVPFAIGGPDSFTTTDVSKDANSRMGTAGDVALVEDPRVLLHRIRLSLAGRSGALPSMPLQGTAVIAGRTRRVTYTLRAGLAPVLKIHPEVLRHDRSANIDCGPEDLEGILGNLDRKFRKRGLTLDLVGAHSQRTLVEDPRITANLSLGVHAFDRAIVKMALGTAHFALGYAWSRTERADNLRQHIGSSDPTTLPRLDGTIPMTGTPAEVKELWGLGPDRHVIALVNPPHAPLIFQCLLFEDIYGMIKLADAPWDEQLIGHEWGLVFVIDCRSRALHCHTVLEFFDLKLNGAFDE